MVLFINSNLMLFSIWHSLNVQVPLSEKMSYSMKGIKGKIKVFDEMHICSLIVASIFY